jgi:hypothetical protein
MNAGEHLVERPFARRHLKGQKVLSGHEQRLPRIGDTFTEVEQKAAILLLQA